MAMSAAPLRSMLFIPANRTKLFGKAVKCGADGVVFDLEDAVPAAERASARAEVRELIGSVSASDPLIFVRINEVHTLAAMQDLAAVAIPGLAGVLIPKVESSKDVVIVDQMLTWLEESEGVRQGTVKIVPILETAAGMRSAFEIAIASDRTAYMGGLGVKGGDVERSIGYRWSATGEETLHIRSRILVDLRAAKVPNPMSGLWSDITDLDGLEAFAQQNRSLGYEAMQAIHPTHVPIINRVFSTTPEEYENDLRLIETVRSAAAAGSGAIVFDGHMVDEAMAARAKFRVEQYRRQSGSESTPQLGDGNELNT